MQYTIVKAIGIDQMEQLVYEHLQSGWVLRGVLSVETKQDQGNETIEYTQAMTKEVSI